MDDFFLHMTGRRHVSFYFWKIDDLWKKHLFSHHWYKTFLQMTDGRHTCFHMTGGRSNMIFLEMTGGEVIQSCRDDWWRIWSWDDCIEVIWSCPKMTGGEVIWSCLEMTDGAVIWSCFEMTNGEAIWSSPEMTGGEYGLVLRWLVEK